MPGVQMVKKVAAPTPAAVAAPIVKPGVKIGGKPSAPTVVVQKPPIKPTVAGKPAAPVVKKAPPPQPEPELYEVTDPETGEVQYLTAEELAALQAQEEADAQAAEAAAADTAGEAVGTVEHVDAEGTVHAESESLGFYVAPAGSSVALRMGMTKNIGNYSSVRFDVSVSFPCEDSDEGREAAFTAAKEWVEGKVNDINTEIDAQITPEA